MYAPARAAGPLGTASDYVSLVNRYLGATQSSIQYDTASVRMALNDGIYRVAHDIGIRGHDTLTLVKGTYDYSMDTIFIPGGTKAMPTEVFIQVRDGTKRHGLHRVGVPAYDGEASSNNPVMASEFALDGKILTISPPVPDSAYIIIRGPINPTWFTNAGASTTNIYTGDAYAVVYWACCTLSQSRGNMGASASWFQKYMNHVASRGGQYDGPPIKTGG